MPDGKRLGCELSPSDTSRELVSVWHHRRTPVKKVGLCHLRQRQDDEKPTNVSSSAANGISTQPAAALQTQTEGREGLRLAPQDDDLKKGLPLRTQRRGPLPETTGVLTRRGQDGHEPRKGQERTLREGGRLQAEDTELIRKDPAGTMSLDFRLQNPEETDCRRLEPPDSSYGSRRCLKPKFIAELWTVTEV